MEVFRGYNFKLVVGISIVKSLGYADIFLWISFEFISTQFNLCGYLKPFPI